MRNLYLLTFVACCFSGCVTSSFPQTVIPESPGEFDASVSLGLISAQVNLQYAISSTLVLGGTHNWSFGPGIIRYNEVRLGAILPFRIDMLTAAFGHGKFELWPEFPIGGTDNTVDNYYGHYQKVSLSWNHQFKPRFGMIFEIANFWGTGSGICSDTYCYNEFHTRHFTVPFSFSALLYKREGKKRNFVFSFGASLFFRDGSKNSDPSFIPNPLLISMGWYFSAKRKG